MIEVMGKLGAGLVLGLGGVGSAFGISVAGQAACGAWAAEAKAGKPLNTSYMVLMATPLSQTLYAWILMQRILDATMVDTPATAMLLLGVGLGVGLLEFASAYGQGLMAAAAVRSLHDGGQGFGFLIAALGIVETVGIFGMVFGFDVTNYALKLSGVGG